MEKIKVDWISVNDKLPENETDNKHDYTWCLTYNEYNREIEIHPFCHFYNCWDTTDGDDTFCYAVGGKITHWVLLPDPPDF